MRYVTVQIDADERGCGKCKYVCNTRFCYECNLFGVNLDQENGVIKRAQQCIDNETKSCLNGAKNARLKGKDR